MFSKNNFESNNHYLYVLISAIFLGFLSYVTNFATGVPTIFCPFSLVVFMPFLFLAFITEQLFSFFNVFTIILSCTVIPIFYLIWSRKLYNNENKIPRRSIILFSISLIFSFIHLIYGWGYGLRYQGKMHMIMLYAVNFIFLCALILLYLFNRKKASFSSNFIFHLTAFTWLTWVAFPWIGELL